MLFLSLLNTYTSLFFISHDSIVWLSDEFFLFGLFSRCSWMETELNGNWAEWQDALLLLLCFSWETNKCSPDDEGGKLVCGLCFSLAFSHTISSSIDWHAFFRLRRWWCNRLDVSHACLLLLFHWILSFVVCQSRKNPRRVNNFSQSRQEKKEKTCWFVDEKVHTSFFLFIIIFLLRRRKSSINSSEQEWNQWLKMWRRNSVSSMTLLSIRSSEFSSRKQSFRYWLSILCFVVVSIQERHRWECE